MTQSTTFRALAIPAMAAVLAAGLARAAAAETTIPLTADRWTATNTIKFETYLGRPSLYIDKGVALARGTSLRDGTLELDMAMPEGGNFMGAVFHAASTDNSEVIWLRPRASGTPEAVQYAPALNSVGGAWKIYHGDGANAVATLPFGAWVHVKIDVTGSVANLYLNGEAKPTLTVPALAGVDGASVGVWTGAFGRGAYFSNVRYTAHPTAPPAPQPPLPPGTLADWQISDALDATAYPPGAMPNLSGVRWQNVRPETTGVVLINRYRRSPQLSFPSDPATGEPLVDRIMNNQVAGEKIVFARTVIQSDRDQLRRILFGYVNGLVIYCNGTPLYFGADVGGGIMNPVGDGVFLPLHKGANEIVFAVSNITGGWGFWARLAQFP
ncbi:MAG: hypothetical protein JO036_12415 [Candidatus Eremiobacteraeota bacterium]|nr:hypothetical protein [Candidatus Eremiobacteraeota bacterium]